MFMDNSIIIIFIITILLFYFHASQASNFGNNNAKYDKNVNLFSNNGELLQVSYAKKAGLKGSTILCSKTKDGDIILCIPTMKENQTLLDRRSIDKVSKVFDNIWFAFSGLAGDGRSLLRNARNFCVEYHSKFGMIPSIKTVVRYISEMQHEATLTGGKRPYGVQVLLLGLHEDECVIYLCESSGETSSWKAISIGENSIKYNSQLETSWKDTLDNTQVVILFIDLLGYHHLIDNDDFSIIHRRNSELYQASIDEVVGTTNIAPNVIKQQPSTTTTTTTTTNVDVLNNNHNEKMEEGAIDLYRFHKTKDRKLNMSIYTNLKQLQANSDKI